MDHYAILLAILYDMDCYVTTIAQCKMDSYTKWIAMQCGWGGLGKGEDVESEWLR